MGARGTKGRDEGGAAPPAAAGGTSGENAAACRRSRQQAARCRTLARATGDERMASVLRQMAGEFDEEARRLQQDDRPGADR